MNTQSIKVSMCERQLDACLSHHLHKVKSFRDKGFFLEVQGGNVLHETKLLMVPSDLKDKLDSFISYLHDKESHLIVKIVLDIVHEFLADVIIVR